MQNNTMDSLTARIMSRSGLNPVDPTLPPVHNMRMVYLKEPFGDAEEALHDARVALEDLENGSGTARDVYTAMMKLEMKEQDYFATRYFGRNKTVLKGWKNMGKRWQFLKKLKRLSEVTENRLDDMGAPFGVAGSITPGYSTEAQNASIGAYDAFTNLGKMTKLWYNRAWYKLLTPSGSFVPFMQQLNASIGKIDATKQTVLKRPQSDSTKIADIRVIESSRKDADTYKRLALMVVNDEWDLPYDLKR
ncbi:unnamed protein product [Ectocarpus sp. 12 AP-2014]